MDRERKSAKRQLWRTAAVRGLVVRPLPPCAWTNMRAAPRQVTAEDHDRIRAAALDTLSKAGIEPVVGPPRFTERPSGPVLVAKCRSCCCLADQDM